MSATQLAAVWFPARYSGRTHHVYQLQLREWFAWCERNGLDLLVGGQRAHGEFSSAVWAKVGYNKALDQLDG